MSKAAKPVRPATSLVTCGRDPQDNHGIVNPPVYHASTILFPTAEKFRKRDQRYVYGRHGTPTSTALETAIASVEGGHACCLAPSGLAAICTAYLAFVRPGDRVLVSDSVYRPNRHFCDSMLSRMGVQVAYYDPLVGAGLSELMTDNTRIVFVESPGSQTFEIQDVPAIAKAAHDGGAIVMADNTWASPLYFDPFSHGVDISIQAATKYIVGHSDVMMGAITANEEHWPAVREAHLMLGQCAGPDDIYLALRGMRTLGVRLAQHMANGIELAHWLQQRPEVAQVMHPALPDDPGYQLWRRDFTGASGLFSIRLQPAPEHAVDAMLDNLKLFGIGASWGGFESLILPFDPASYRTASPWKRNGPCIRIHAGLEDISDLKSDLEEGFARLRAAVASE